MKNALRKLVAVAMFCGAGASVACGNDLGNDEMAGLAQDEQPQLTPQMQALVEFGEDLAFAGGQTSKECKKINARMAKDGRAMARTKQFKAMIRTQAYKDLAHDIVEMKKKGCSMSPGGGGGDAGGGINFECLSLQITAYQHQQALMATPEYKALEKTKAYKKLNADLQEAQQKGCIKMATDILDTP